MGHRPPMIRIPPLAAVLLALTLPGAALAQTVTPPEGFTWLVLKGLNDLHDDPEDPTNGPPIVTEVPDGVLKPIDINHDDRTDWLIDWPEETSVCGTGGCLKSLYVSGPDGFTRALERQVLEFDIRTVGEEVRIEAMVHHGECPSQEVAGDWDCRYAWAWDEQARALIPRPTRGGGSIMDGAGAPPVEPIEIDGRTPPPVNLPEPIAALWESAKVVCAADWAETGQYALRPTIGRLPDVDGDGLADWSVVLPRDCDAAPEGGVLIWRAGTDNSATPIYEGATAARFRTDLSTSPATVSVSTDCQVGGDGAGEPCRYVSLHWNAVTRRLEPSA